ncbi:MAG: prepilin peptidase [Oscillospiraceae bacterium]|nr:prepilin peptidase [Oscillospiraceae bacterium]
MISIYQNTGLLAYSCTVAGVLGAVMGSFLNCAAGRMAKDEPFIKGRSHCPACGHVLETADLVPVFSWLFLKGKCRHCGVKISPRYLCTELLFAAISIVCLLYFDLTVLCLRNWVMLCCLFCLSLVDFESRIIPNGTLLFAAGAWVVAEPFLFENWTKTLAHVGTSLVISGGLLLISMVMDRVLKRESLGGGDVKLFAVVGLYLGLLSSMFMLILSCVLGLAVNLPRQKGSSEPFPFGPWIAIATAIMLFFGDKLVLWYLGIMGVLRTPSFLM